MLLLRGGNILSVSKLLGHRNVTQTLDVYAHVMPHDLVEVVGHLPPFCTPVSQGQGGGAQVTG